MAVRYGPFNGIENAWDANDFARYLKLFFGNGVFPNPSDNLQVVTHGNMQTKIKVGYGWINGHMLWNDSDYILSHDIADGMLKRIDRVVMRVNYLERKMEFLIKKGTSSSSPVAPTLVRNTDYHELALADVIINNGATSIVQANITDQRLNTTLCGVVATNINQLDTTTLAIQYQNAFEQMTIEQRQAFEDWLATLQDVLDGDVAANLAMRILAAENNFIQHLEDTDKHITQAEKNKIANAFINNSPEDLAISKGVPGVYLKTPTGNAILSLFLNANNTVNLGGILRMNGMDLLRFIGPKDIRFEDANGVWSSLADLKQSGVNAKSAVVTAINAKGGIVTTDDEWATIASAISNIQTLGRSQSGTANISTSQYNYTILGGETRSFKEVVVSGLPFLPRFIQFYYSDPTRRYITNLEPIAMGGCRIRVTSQAHTSANAESSYLVELAGRAYITNGGFALPISIGASGTVQYVAYE